MSEFTQNTVSSFPSQNILYNSAAGITAQGLRTNELLNQGRQMDLTAADHEQVSRLSAALLNEPDVAKRADLYARGVGMLQSQGLAKYAPATLPDESTLRMLAAQGVPAKDMYTLSVNQTAKQNLLPTDGTTGTGTGTTPGTGAAPSLAIPARGTGGPGASASAPTAWLPYFEEASKETGIPVDLLIAQARQESSFDPNAKGTAGEIGLFQIKDSTARAPAGMAGVDPASITGPENVRNNILFGARYLKAQMGSGDPNNPAVQAAALHRYNGGGDPKYVEHVFGYRPTLAPSDPNATVTTYTPGGGTGTASAAPTGGVAARTGGTDTAGPAAGPTAAPGASVTPLPPDQAVTQAKATVSDLPPIPQPPAPPQVKRSGYTADQEQTLRKAANDPTVSADEFRKQQNSFLTTNAAANEKSYADAVTYANAMRERAAMLDKRATTAAEQQRAAETARLASEAAQRAVEAAQRAKEQHDLTMRTQGLPAGQQRDDAGTAKPIPGYREPPPPGYRYNEQGAQEIIPGGPADPATVKSQADARLEPPPGYRRQADGSLQIIPGGPADPEVLKTQAEAKGAGGRNMPPTERDKLIKAAGQIDEIGLLKNNFQDYGGYWTSSIGDMANYIARNTPGDSARAEWWQEYQRQKLAARQLISGQSLTSSELGEYDKADINPGMSNDTIRKNLELQQNILTRARDRTVLSMAKDGYNPGAIEEAAAVRLQDAQSRMSKDIIQQGTTANKPLANTKIKVDANGKIISP